MKKLLALVLALVMVMGCSAAMADKLGLGVVSVISAGHSHDASEDALGAAEVDATIATVTVDDAGVITACKIDVAQISANFDTEGKLVDIDKADVRSKYEKQGDYGMKGVSASKGAIADGGEWFEQADFFAAYCVGKTIDEVKAGLALDESNYPTAEDVIAGCTMAMGDIVAAVEKAVANAQ